MNDSEIIKALEYCVASNDVEFIGICKGCPMDEECDKDCDALTKNALDLINRLKRESNSYRNKVQIQKGELARLNKQVAEQKAEIEYLEKENMLLIDRNCALAEKGEKAVISLVKSINEVKSEAIKEFAERYKKEIFKTTHFNGYVYSDLVLSIFDNLVKEMTEGKE